MPLLDEIATYLTAQGLASAGFTPLSQTITGLWRGPVTAGNVTIWPDVYLDGVTFIKPPTGSYQMVFTAAWPTSTIVLKRGATTLVTTTWITTDQFSSVNLQWQEAADVAAGQYRLMTAFKDSNDLGPDVNGEYPSPDGALTWTYNAGAGGPIFISVMPEQPSAVIALYEYSGAWGFETFNRLGKDFEQPRFQIVCRDLTWPLVNTTMNLVYTALDAINNQNLSGVRYLQIRALQAPFTYAQGRDFKNRYRAICNFEALRAAVS